MFFLIHDELFSLDNDKRNMTLKIYKMQAEKVYSSRGKIDMYIALIRFFIALWSFIALRRFFILR